MVAIALAALGVGVMYAFERWRHWMIIPVIEIEAQVTNAGRYYLLRSACLLLGFEEAEFDKLLTEVVRAEGKYLTFLVPVMPEQIKSMLQQT